VSGADFLDDQLLREAWLNGDLVSDRHLQEQADRDARTLAWLVTNLGADVLLAAVDRTTGGSLGQRMQRLAVRRRIEELGGT